METTPTPKPKPTHYTATAPDGTIFSRKSPRTYTHAVLSSYRTAEGAIAWSVDGWAGRPDLAQKLANSLLTGKWASALTLEVVIVETEVK